MKKIFLTVFILSVIMSPSFAQAISKEALLAQIQALFSIVHHLQELLAKRNNHLIKNDVPEFCSNLEAVHFGIGIDSPYVSQLQFFLKKNGYFTKRTITNHYGQATVWAVQKYQCEKFDLCSGNAFSNGYGLAGPNTRNKICKTSFNSCPINNSTVEHGSSTISYKRGAVPFGSTCQKEVRACNNGTLTGTYVHATCVVQDANACTATDGTMIPHTNRESRIRYLTNFGQYNNMCKEQRQIRTCNNGQWGAWGGTYSASHCNSAPNTPPQINNITGPITTQNTETNRYIVAAVDSEGQPIRYAVKWNSGESRSSWQTSKVFNKVFNFVKPYNATFYAIDSEGAISERKKAVLVRETPIDLPTSLTLNKGNYPEYKVFQRDKTNKYSFELSGSYSGPCHGVEASFNNGSFSTIEATVSDGIFFGYLPNQTIGQGELIVRCINHKETYDKASNIGIGDIFVIAGQSNAEGNAQNKQFYTTTADTSQIFPTVYTDGDTWKIANDDTDPGGGAGSPWPILGGYIAENTGIPIEFITTADGGSGLVSPAQWPKGSAVNCKKGIPCFENMVNQVQKAGANGIKAILWFQGEIDSNYHVSRQAYNTALDKFIYDAQIHLPGTPDLVAGTIGPMITSPLSSTQIRLATQDAWDDNSHVLYGPQMYDIHITHDDAGDNIHYFTDDEIQTFAFRWWKALEKHYYGGISGRGPVVNGANISIDRKKITITFISSSKLRGGTSKSIWSITDGSARIPVLKAQIVTDHSIELTLLKSAITNDITVTYASGNSAENKDVLTDSTLGNTAAGKNYLPADVFNDFPVTQ